MKVWMLAFADGPGWVPDRLCASRESALACIPEGSEHAVDGAGEHWRAPRAAPYWCARLWIQEWEITGPVKMWMVLREGDSMHPWFPVTLHTSREAAVAAIPAGSEHHPAGPNAEWDPLDREQWTAPRDGRYWYGARLRIEEWEATP